MCRSRSACCRRPWATSQVGKLRAIAVTGTRRFSLLPDVPTAAESGLPGFDSVLLYGLIGPAGMPRDIVDRLNKELRAMAETDLVKQRVQAEGGDVMPSTPEEYAQSHRSRRGQVVGADPQAQSAGGIAVAVRSRRSG